MATTTGPTTVAVAVAAARIMKCGGSAGAGVLLPYSSSLTFVFNRSRIAIISPRRRATFTLACIPSNAFSRPSLSGKYGSSLGIQSFCTAPKSSTSEVDTSSLSSSEPPPSSSNKDGKKEEEPTVKELGSMLDIRVGKIVKAWRHEEADSLYVEEVDVGEAEPRTICSGLVNFIPLPQLQDRKVVVLANLKARNMRGVKSNGMLMAASDASHENVELLEPPEDSVPGERIWFGSPDDKLNQPPPATPNQVQKKKIWESVQPHLKTDDSCKAMLGENFMQTSAGVVVCRSLKNANVS